MLFALQRARRKEEMGQVAADPALNTFAAPIHGRLTLSSVFQPIFSPAHGRAIAHEGLIRASDASGQGVAPFDLFATVPPGESRIRLDRQCRRLHVDAFQRLGDPRSWLFLNVDPYVAVEGRRYGSFFGRMLQEAGLPAHRVAVELVEAPFADEARLAAAVDYYRELGCTIVIDDFGAGSSNFDRIWRLRPDIVKIDREMTRRVAVEPLARRMFAGIVALLHEAGALVCVEGIETEAEALCATDANADMMQGYYFAMPGAGAPAEHACRSLFDKLFTAFHCDAAALRRRREARLQPYFVALEDATRALSAGRDYVAAVRPLLNLSCTQRCYLMSGDGAQIGENIDAERNVSARDPRLEPMRPTPGTSWQTKPYYRRAIETMGAAQITRPYLSVTGPKLCVTLSVAFRAPDGATRVLCADLDFQALAGEDLAFGGLNPA
jgi:EAL domain-containing protein (putative c-di-GMP-specific phosphodiesterase class I)